MRERLKKTLALEETLGANWLNKVGVAFLVLGVVSLLVYQFGGTPAGKIFLGYTGACLLHHLRYEPRRGGTRAFFRSG
jgi:hypothetical protein